MAGVDTLNAAVASPADNVATVLAKIKAGDEITLRLMATGEALGYVTARQDIPARHKIACSDIERGTPVFKFGRPIGKASRPIFAGEHVHTHNLVSGPESHFKADLPPPIIRPAAWLRRLLVVLAGAGGMPGRVASSFSDVLVEAHLRGVETHGVRRLKPYLERIGQGGVDARADPRIERRGNILRVDGRNGVGHHVAAVTADETAKAAKETGIALALVRNSNHFGFAGYYATRIAACGQVGLVSSNGQVLIAPPGGRIALFSNNPVAVAAPAGPDAFMEMDLATSMTSRAKIAMAAEKGEPIARGLAIDQEGMETTDARAALNGTLLPLGGDKGFALLFALEVITGVLGGGAYADLVSSKERAPGSPERLSHLMAAVDIHLVLGIESFSRRMGDLVRRLRAVPLRSGSPPARYPGQRRWELRRGRLKQGLPLTVSEFEDLSSLARSYGVPLD